MGCPTTQDNGTVHGWDQNGPSISWHMQALSLSLSLHRCKHCNRDDHRKLLGANISAWEPAWWRELPEGLRIHQSSNRSLLQITSLFWINSCVRQILVHCKDSTRCFIFFTQLSSGASRAWHCSILRRQPFCTRGPAGKGTVETTWSNNCKKHQVDIICIQFIETSTPSAFGVF